MQVCKKLTAELGSTLVDECPKFKKWVKSGLRALCAAAAESRAQRHVTPPRRRERHASAAADPDDDHDDHDGGGGGGENGGDDYNDYDDDDEEEDVTAGVKKPAKRRQRSEIRPMPVSIPAVSVIPPKSFETPPIESVTQANQLWVIPLFVHRSDYHECMIECMHA